MLFAGCTKEPAESSDAAPVRITLSLGTYAVNEDPNALPEEMEIASAYVYIFNAGGYLENPGAVEIPLDTTTGEAIDSGNNLNRTWTVLQGQKNIYVLINPGTMLLHNGLQPDLASYPFTERELLSLRNSAATFDSDFSGTKPEGLLMSGKVHVDVSGTAQTVTIPVVRRYAAIEFQLCKKADLTDVVVKLNKATLVSQNICDYAFAEQGNLSVLKEVITNRPVGLSPNYRTVGSYYTLPQLALSVPLRFDLDITYGGRNMVVPVYINRGALNGNTANDKTKPLNIEANRIYLVKATLSRQNIDLEVTIRDWDDQAVKGDIAGSMLAVSHSTVAMDWWNLKQRFDTSVDYVSDGTVSFVGYVLKNTNGTDASITTDGSNLPSWLPKTNITGLPDGTTTGGTIGLEYVITEETSHPDVALRIKTGNIIKDITVKYDNGYIPNDLLVAKGWPQDALPAYGLQLSKAGNKHPSDTSSNDDQIYWATVATSIPGAQATGFGFGSSNTDTIIAALGSQATAAGACRSLGEQWYLATRDEMSLGVYANKNCFGASYRLRANYYWTSSEYSTSPGSVWIADDLITGKNSTTIPVRCVRSIGLDLAATRLSADWYNWGQSFSTDVTFESAVGVVSIQSIDNSGSTKNWLTSAVVSGAESGKITITYEPTVSEVHDDVVITLTTTGGITKTITVTYDNGFIPNSLLAAQGWPEDVLPARGVHLAKKGNKLPNETADATWDNEESTWTTTFVKVFADQPASLPFGAGPDNTSKIVNYLGANSAAARCASMQNPDDWYQPSNEELKVFRDLKNVVGVSYQFSGGIYPYWSSSEASGTAQSQNAYYVAFAFGSDSFALKTYSYHVRCIRNY